MPLYESTFIARPEISAQQAEALAERFAGIITENGGKVEKTEHWGLKSLAYRIKKHRKGHYVMFNLDAPSDAVKEMERNMKIDEDVLRILTIRVKELEEGPSAMMLARASRDDRGGRGERGDRRYGERHDGGHDRKGGRDHAAPETGATEKPPATDAAEKPPATDTAENPPATDTAETPPNETERDATNDTGGKE